MSENDHKVQWGIRRAPDDGQVPWPVGRIYLFVGFVDLEKAFDRVPREVIRCAMSKL